ncbi:MAG TPA: sugar phosphate nucleotidyltransferase, partial [Candidatus Paceibacterota bacterium]|nr:sugar phosphate nucleotidyltransferase [Candidatus Paceibacterota bacterium]
MRPITKKDSLGPRDYAVIQAGGNGTRLWPISRKSKPKQFQLLLGNQSLLQRMHGLLLRSFEHDRIFIQVPPQFVPLVREQFPELPAEQVIIEPESRDTGPAFAYSAAVLYGRDPEARIGFFYSDHLIQSEHVFKQTLTTGFKALSSYPDHLVMLGVRPLYAHTGLGYIERGEKKHVPGLKNGVYNAQAFIEKPDIGRA